MSGAEAMFYSDVRSRPAPAASISTLLWAALLLLALGLVMVYSASIAIAEGSRVTGHQPAYYLMRHGVFLAVSLVLAAVAFQVPLRVWQQARAVPVPASASCCSLLVLMPGVGREVNGSRRWLSLVVINLQPSELMKLFAVLYAADYTVRKAADMHSFRKGFLPMFVRDAAGRRPAAARAGFRRLRRDHGDRDGHPVSRRHELAAVRRR